MQFTNWHPREHLYRLAAVGARPACPAGRPGHCRKSDVGFGQNPLFSRWIPAGTVFDVLPWGSCLSSEQEIACDKLKFADQGQLKVRFRIAIPVTQHHRAPDFDVVGDRIHNT